MQYAWIFNYPSSGIIAGELHVPVGQDVQLNIAAQDVIHSFWVPQFRLKQDAIPGQPTGLRFVATKEGSFPIVCTELCGSYHGAMRSQVIVHSPEDFDSWLVQNQIAQQLEPTDPQQILAANPTDLTPGEFLAPYAEAAGVTTDVVQQLQAVYQ
jgi:cytochrome c oxidase subunit 2